MQEASTKKRQINAVQLTTLKTSATTKTYLCDWEFTQTNPSTTIEAEASSKLQHMWVAAAGVKNKKWSKEQTVLKINGLQIVGQIEQNSIDLEDMRNVS